MNTLSCEIIPSDKKMEVIEEYVESESEDFLSFSASAASVMAELENEEDIEPRYISLHLNNNKEKSSSSAITSIKSPDNTLQEGNIKKTIFDCCSSKNGCNNMVKYYLTATADVQELLFDEFYTSIVEFLQHKFANFFIQDILPQLTLLQMVKVLPFLKQHLSNLSKDPVGNFPFQKMMECICNKLVLKTKEHEETKEENDCLIQFRTFLDEVLDSLSWKAGMNKGTTETKSILYVLSCHSIGNNVIQCFLRNFPLSQKSRLLSELIPYLDDCINDNHGIFIIQCITKQLIELSTNDDTSQILFSSTEKTKKFKNIMIKTFMIECFGLFSPPFASPYPFSPSLSVAKSNAKKMLAKTCSYNLLKRLLAYTGEEYLRKIISFLEEHSDDIVKGSTNGMNYLNWVKAEVTALERLRDMRMRSDDRRRENDNYHGDYSDYSDHRLKDKDVDRAQENSSSFSLKRKSSDFNPNPEKKSRR
jgi:hypothetical protein